MNVILFLVGSNFTRLPGFFLEFFKLLWILSFVLLLQLLKEERVDDLLEAEEGCM